MFIYNLVMLWAQPGLLENLGVQERELGRESFFVYSPSRVASVPLRAQGDHQWALQCSEEGLGEEYWYRKGSHWPRTSLEGCWVGDLFLENRRT